MTDKKVATVIGVGPGLGAALARRFAADHAVALVARNAEKLIELAREISTAGGTSLVVPADVSKEQEVVGAFQRIRRELGDTDVLLYNAAMRPFGTLMDTKPSTFENTWRVGTFGAFLAAQQVVPAMLQRRRGVILFTGATASVKAFPQSAAFAIGKFGLRALAQSMARELAPKNIHVAHIVIDGGIASSYAKSAEDRGSDRFLDPDAIAREYLHLIRQHGSAWTWELELRPYSESF